MTPTTKALIYKENLRHNLREIKKHLAPNVKMCVAVKADGYGHGSVLTSKIAVEEGADFLAVARVQEGIELREAGITARILLLSLCAPEEFPDLFRYNITPFVFGEEHIKRLDEAAAQWFVPKLPVSGPTTPAPNCLSSEQTKSVHQTPSPFPVHLAVDTGMGRIGCLPDEAAEQAKLIASSACLALEGMGTHFAVSDSLLSENIEFTKKQFAGFTRAVESVKAAGIGPKICHAGASAVILSHADFHLDMVRPGIITYGYYPDEITREYLAERNIDIDLKPVMQFETRVSAIRHFKKGQSVSYGRTWKCESDTDIAVLPVGYADGLLRRFSPGLKVAINGRAYPVVGRICMDQCMVDIGKDNGEVRVWDRVVIFGPAAPKPPVTEQTKSPPQTPCTLDNQTTPPALQSAEALAEIGNTISYEVLTTIGKRVVRVEI